MIEKYIVYKSICSCKSQAGHRQVDLVKCISSKTSVGNLILNKYFYYLIMKSWDQALILKNVFHRRHHENENIQQHVTQIIFQLISIEICTFLGCKFGNL